MKKILVAFILIASVQLGFSQDIRKEVVATEEGYDVTYYNSSNDVVQIGEFNKLGEKNGEWKTFKDNKVTAIAHFEDGKKSGTWMVWTNDSLKEITYQDTKLKAIKSWDNAQYVVKNP